MNARGYRHGNLRSELLSTHFFILIHEYKRKRLLKFASIA
jgi:hypothetical protein